MYGVIDIGSNSVRLLIQDGNKKVCKLVKTTRLLSSFNENGEIDFVKAENTVSAISLFIEKAKEFKVDKLFVFATAGVRNAKNSLEFKSYLDNRLNIDLDIVSGEIEALIGSKGALSNKDGGVIDVGGASTEICVIKNGKRIYGKSLPFGAVFLTKKFGNDRIKIEKFLQEEVKKYGEVPECDFYAIGGTATSLSAMVQNLPKYDSNLTDGYCVSKNELYSLTEKIYSMDINGRLNISCLQKERVDIIHSGLSIFCVLFNYLHIESLTVSEKDNLEGYLSLMMEKI